MLLPFCLSASLHPNLWSTLMTRLCSVSLGHLVNPLLLPWTHEPLAQLSAPFQETAASTQHPDFSSLPPHLPPLAAHCHPPELFTSKALMTVTITSIPTALFRPISSLFSLFSQLTLHQNDHHFSRKLIWICFPFYQALLYTPRSKPGIGREKQICLETNNRNM